MKSNWQARAGRANIPQRVLRIQLFGSFRVPYTRGRKVGRKILAESRFFYRSGNFGFAAKAAAFFLLVFTWAALASAQTGAMSPNQDESDGVNAGGNWLVFRSTDKMTGHKKVRFELQSNNYFREDNEYKPRVNLICDDGKLKLADFNPGVRLPPPNRPGWWGQPQIEVEVGVDDSHYHKGWNWLR